MEFAQRLNYNSERVIQLKNSTDEHLLFNILNSWLYVGYDRFEHNVEMASKHVVLWNLVTLAQVFKQV